MSTPLRTLFNLPSSPLPLFVLAPMAGYTDAAMRTVCSRHGADLCYTEMTNGYGLLREEEKTWHLLESLEEEGPLVAHLYGADPGVMGEAAARVSVSRRFVGIDLNAGCPVRKVTAGGAGSALIKDPEKIYSILDQMVRSTSLPVTLKSRIGPSPDRVNMLEILDAAERAGASALTLHGRFTSQRHSGEVHFDLLAACKARAKIPLIANGGVLSPSAAWRTWKETGCDGVMIARGAVGNPWIFEDIKEGWREDEPPDERLFPGEGRSRRDLDQIYDAFETHLQAEKRLQTRIRTRYAMPIHSMSVDEALVSTFRCHLFRYLKGLQGSGYLRRQLLNVRCEEDIYRAVRACLENEREFRETHPAFTC